MAENPHSIVDASRAAVPRASDGTQPPQTPVPLIPTQETPKR